MDTTIARSEKNIMPFSATDTLLATSAQTTLADLSRNSGEAPASPIIRSGS